MQDRLAKELFDALLPPTPDVPRALALLKEGALPTHRDDKSRSPLHLAVALPNCDIELVKELVRAGNPWNTLDETGKCPGQYATEGSEVWEWLVNEGMRTELLFSVLGGGAGQDMDEDDDADEQEEGDNGDSNAAASNGEKKVFEFEIPEGQSVEQALVDAGISLPGQEADEMEEADADAGQGQGKKRPLSADETESAPQSKKRIPNADYLSQPLHRDSLRLLDSASNGVMMSWETPIMRAHAEALLPAPGLRILNVGFGMGIIDTIIQEKSPSLHVICEAHPDVLKSMREAGWDSKPGVKIVAGRWQDALESGELLELGPFDAIFWDTFGEHYEDMREFHEALVDLLDQENGVYSFFNGLGGDNRFFHEVYCRIVAAELGDLSMKVEFTDIELPPEVLDESGEAGTKEEWDGVKRKYWMLGKRYRMPLARFVL